VLRSDEDEAPEESEVDLGKLAKDGQSGKLPGKQFEVGWLDPNEAGISREEQLRRMNILAAEFNFFAVDRPDQSLVKLLTPGKSKV
jgi:dihydroxyacetone kinase